MFGRIGYPIPAWRVILGGEDLTDRLKPRLLELSLNEARSGEADQLDLKLHDHDGQLALPRRGVLLSVALGWQDEGLIDKGTFTVDELEHSGSPDVLTLRARSADLTHPMRTRRERSWHQTTLGEILDGIAGEHGLAARISPALASIAMDHIDQANESDVHLLTRLAKRFDAVATVKAGRLLFAPIGSGQSPSGIALPTARIQRQDGDQHRYAMADRDSYSGVKAVWNSKKHARHHAVVVGGGDNLKELREVYSTEAQARDHAQAAWNRIQRGTATLSYTLALGRADLYPEQRVSVSGFKAEIDAASWLICKTTHSITPGAGFTTAVELETAI